MSELSLYDLGAEQRAIEWLQAAQVSGLAGKEIADSRPQIVVDQMALQAARLRERLISLYPPEGLPIWLRDVVQVEQVDIDADYERSLKAFNVAVDAALHEGGPVPLIPEELWRYWGRSPHKITDTNNADTHDTY